MNLEFDELTTTIQLKKDIHFSMSSEIIGKNINRSMLNDSELLKYHKEKKYKYVFNNFFPLEKDGIYKKNRIYVFKIRCFDRNIISRIQKCLRNYKSQDLIVVSTDLWVVKQKQINFIETLTPAVITVDNAPWLISDDLLLLVKRIHANAEKKYKLFMNEEIGQVEDYFIEKLKILNKKPLCYKYKNVKLLAHKFRIKVNEDEKSQKLAFIALGAGLLEKNSALGAGFCTCDERRWNYN